MEIQPTKALELFDADSNMLSVGVPALRIVTTAWLCSLPGLVLTSSMQGLSLGGYGMVVTVARQAVFPIVFAFVFQFFGNANLIWFSFVLVEIVGIPIAVGLWRRASHKLL